MTTTRIIALKASAALIALCVPAAAFAQDAKPASTQDSESADPGDSLETIIVTARKRARAEELQSMPTSITAISAEQLSKGLAVDLVDVGRMTPNASLQPSSQRGVQNFSIRGMGVSGSTPSDEPAVGIFQDGVYWGTNYGALGEVFDLEGVEFTRGPQGTLFGRNVTGGAVTFRSARPTTEPMARVTVGASTGPTIEGSAVVSGPIVKDKLAVCLAVLGRRNDGLFTNTLTDSSYGKVTTFLVRPSIKWTPNETVDITLLGEYYKQYGDPAITRSVSPSTLAGPIKLPQREGYTSPADYFSVSPEVPGNSDVTSKFGLAELNWEVGPGVVTSITGYRELRARSLTDQDGSPSAGFIHHVREDQRQWSEELRYAADFSEWFGMTAGLYYFSQNLRYGETRDLNNHASKIAAAATLKNTSYAAFAEADIKPVAGLTLTLGGRYTEETKKVTNAPFGACTFDLAPCTFQTAPAYKGNNFSPKVGLSYEVSKDKLFFASWTRGYRSGGFSLRGTNLAAPYQPETVDAYEAGFKSDFLDHRVRFNVAGYYNKFKNLQRTVLGVDPLLGTIQSVFNAASAHIQGVEVEIAAIPVSGLTLSAAYGHTNAKYESFLGLANPGVRHFVRVPDDTLNLTGDYESRLDNGDTVGFRLSGAYTSRYYYDDPNLLSQAPYWLVDANLYYKVGDKLTVSVWSRNLINTKYAPWGSNLGDPGQKLILGDPRTVGIRLTGNF